MSEFTKEDIKDLVAAVASAVVAESKKPAPPTEKELQEVKRKQEERLVNAEGVKEEAANKKALQERCTHEHSKRDGGASHCVHVKEQDPRSPGYILCQVCLVKVRPDYEFLRKLDPTAMFDTELYNRLFQDCNLTEGVIIQ